MHQDTLAPYFPEVHTCPKFDIEFYAPWFAENPQKVMDRQTASLHIDRIVLWLKNSIETGWVGPTPDDGEPDWIAWLKKREFSTKAYGEMLEIFRTNQAKFQDGHPVFSEWADELRMTRVLADFNGNGKFRSEMEQIWQEVRMLVPQEHPLSKTATINLYWLAELELFLDGQAQKRNIDSARNAELGNRVRKVNMFFRLCLTEEVYGQILAVEKMFCALTLEKCVQRAATRMPAKKRQISAMLGTRYLPVGDRTKKALAALNLNGNTQGQECVRRVVKLLGQRKIIQKKWTDLTILQLLVTVFNPMSGIIPLKVFDRLDELTPLMATPEEQGKWKIQKARYKSIILYHLFGRIVQEAAYLALNILIFRKELIVEPVMQTLWTLGTALTGAPWVFNPAVVHVVLLIAMLAPQIAGIRMGSHAGNMNMRVPTLMGNTFENWKKFRPHTMKKYVGDPDPMIIERGIASGLSAYMETVNRITTLIFHSLFLWITFRNPWVVALYLVGAIVVLTLPQVYLAKKFWFARHDDYEKARTKALETTVTDEQINGRITGLFHFGEPISTKLMRILNGSLVMNIFPAVVTMLILVVMGSFTGDFAVIFLIIGGLASFKSFIGNFFGLMNYERARAEMDRLTDHIVNNDIDLQPQISRRPALPVPPRQGTLVLDRVTIPGEFFEFRLDRPLRFDRPLNVIVGLNGAGKSVLMKMMTQQMGVAPESPAYAAGRRMEARLIKIGPDGQEWAMDGRNAPLVYLEPHKNFDTSITVRKLFAETGFSDEEIISTLWDFRAPEERANSFGVQNRTLEKKISEFSTGQQLVIRLAAEMARIAVRCGAGTIAPPAMVVLDEPFANIDPATRVIIMQTIMRLRERPVFEGTQFFVVSHENRRLFEGYDADFWTVDKGTVTVTELEERDRAQKQRAVEEDFESLLASFEAGAPESEQDAREMAASIAQIALDNPENTNMRRALGECAGRLGRSFTDETAQDRERMLMQALEARLTELTAEGDPRGTPYVELLLGLEDFDAAMKIAAAAPETALPYFEKYVRELSDPAKTRKLLGAVSGQIIRSVQRHEPHSGIYLYAALLAEASGDAYPGTKEIGSARDCNGLLAGLFVCAEKQLRDGENGESLAAVAVREEMRIALAVLEEDARKPLIKSLPLEKYAKFLQAYTERLFKTAPAGGYSDSYLVEIGHSVQAALREREARESGFFFDEPSRTLDGHGLFNKLLRAAQKTVRERNMQNHEAFTDELASVESQSDPVRRWGARLAGDFIDSMDETQTCRFALLLVSGEDGPRQRLAESYLTQIVNRLTERQTKPSGDPETEASALILVLTRLAGKNDMGWHRKKLEKRLFDLLGQYPELYAKNKEAVDKYAKAMRTRAAGYKDRLNADYYELVLAAIDESAEPRTQAQKTADTLARMVEEHGCRDGYFFNELFGPLAHYLVRHPGDTRTAELVRKMTKRGSSSHAQDAIPAILSDLEGPLMEMRRRWFDDVLFECTHRDGARELGLPLISAMAQKINDPQTGRENLEFYLVCVARLKNRIEDGMMDPAHAFLSVAEVEWGAFMTETNSAAGYEFFSLRYLRAGEPLLTVGVLSHKSPLAEKTLSKTRETENPAVIEAGLRAEVHEELRRQWQNPDAGAWNKARAIKMDKNRFDDIRSALMAKHTAIAAVVLLLAVDPESELSMEERDYIFRYMLTQRHQWLYDYGMGLHSFFRQLENTVPADPALQQLAAGIAGRKEPPAGTEFFEIPLQRANILPPPGKKQIAGELADRLQIRALRKRGAEAIAAGDIGQGLATADTVGKIEKQKDGVCSERAEKILRNAVRRSTQNGEAKNPVYTALRQGMIAQAVQTALESPEEAVKAAGAQAREEILKMLGEELGAEPVWTAWTKGPAPRMMFLPESSVQGEERQAAVQWAAMLSQFTMEKLKDHSGMLQQIADRGIPFFDICVGVEKPRYDFERQILYIDDETARDPYRLWSLFDMVWYNYMNCGEIAAAGATPCGILYLRDRFRHITYIRDMDPYLGDRSAQEMMNFGPENLLILMDYQLGRALMKKSHMEDTTLKSAA